MATKRTKSTGAAEAAPDVAEEVFAFHCAARGFNLRLFDDWLAGIADVDTAEPLRLRRAKAIEALRENAQDCFLRHLEFMRSAMMYIAREASLLPLARTGKQVADRRSAGGKKAAAHRRDDNAARDARLVKRAKGLIASGEATPRTVSAQMKERGLSEGLHPKTVRSILRKADVR